MKVKNGRGRVTIRVAAFRERTDDPQNAYYDYLTAELWFNHAEPNYAVQDLEAAVRKPFVQRHIDQIPYNSAYNKTAGERMERWASERSAAIDKRKGELSKPPEDEAQKK